MDHFHYIIIDGLDSTLTSRENQYKALAGLIIQANRMNNKFRENNVKAKIIVLCRNDLLDKLSDPNKNKIITDSGIILDWHQDVKDIKSTYLYEIINLRASNSLKRDVDVFSEFFPPTIGDKDTAKFLIEHTRHTPRDIIQIMNKIQKVTSKNRLTQDDVWNGLRQYSIEYFIGEIRDEMTGFMADKEKEDILNLLASMGDSIFSYSELKERANEIGLAELDLDKTLTVLYNCGAIGNFDVRRKRFTYAYRNRNVQFNKFHNISIHRGLYKAMNIEPTYYEDNTGV